MIKTTLLQHRPDRYSISAAEEDVMRLKINQ